MTKLSVNLNKVALLRNQRDIGIPSVIEAAKVAIDAGAHGITVHPRPDERHIRYSDVFELAEMLNVEFNIEGNPFMGRYIEIAGEVRPNQVTFVPDSPGAVTSDHGWDLAKDGQRLVPVIRRLKEAGIRVSLFVDADIEVMKIAKEIDADRIELYTEPYASAFASGENLEQVTEQYAAAGQAAADAGLGINAGHDLNLKNLGLFCSRVAGVMEVSIGHALIADALEMGLHTAVSKYLKILEHRT